MFTLYSSDLYPSRFTAILTLPQIILCVAVLAILTSISVTDIRKKQIPDIMNLALLACGAIAIWIFPNEDIISRIIGIFCVSVPLFIIAIAIKNSFGMGDVKLMASAGFLLGWQYTLTAFMTGTLLGGIYGTILLVMRKKTRKDSFAFGPCLAIGIFTALIFGNEISSFVLK